MKGAGQTVFMLDNGNISVTYKCWSPNVHAVHILMEKKGK